jgi:hypothetical protein
VIVWCKECDVPMAYRDGAGLRWPHYHSATDRPTCGPCSISRLSVGVAPTEEQ